MYEIDITDEQEIVHFTHIQDPSQTKFGTTHLMDDDYAHDDKPIFIFDRDIRPDELKIVTGVSSRIFNNKIYITEKLYEHRTTIHSSDEGDPGIGIR